MYFKKYFKNYLAQRKISGGKITQDDVHFGFSNFKQCRLLKRREYLGR